MHLTHALVLHGPPKYAKTPLAKSIASNLAAMHQAEMYHEGFFLLVSTAESLPRAGDRRMKTGVPIVFDDMKPNENRNGRPPHTFEDMKVMGDVEVGGDMAGRYRDIHFEPDMPRIYTSNANDPSDFFNAFPSDLKTMTDTAVMGLSNDMKSLIKRFAFCEVPCCVIPVIDRQAHQTRRCTNLDKIAESMFSGANAII